MHLPGRESSALMLAALFLLAGTGNVVRGENTPPSVNQSTGKEIETKEVQPLVKTTEPWEIKVGGPGWLANVSGITGFHGFNQNISVDVGQILRHVNVIYAFNGEVRKGRFGVFGGLLYLNGQAGTPEGSGLVSKVDLGLQEFGGQLFGSYRVIDGPRGWLDLLVGFRDIYIGQQVGLQANNRVPNWWMRLLNGWPSVSRIWVLSSAQTSLVS